MCGSVFVLSSLLSVFIVMIRRPPRSTLDRSSAASDVYKRQLQFSNLPTAAFIGPEDGVAQRAPICGDWHKALAPVSYTHLRAHETVLDLVCRLLLEQKKL